MLFDGLPGWPGAPDDLLAGAADRDTARAAISEAVADQGVDPAEVPALEAEVT
ncbi:hypothetical protein [Micromonospora viridifaciens]|uniref:hypothetical protein n=1 Tax=Micromonospora viridifaciens TaxID=1881 RepID=UPI00142DF3E5|nr:hypothetical protein [Micromonospora viridifaciens]